MKKPVIYHDFGASILLCPTVPSISALGTTTPRRFLSTFFVLQVITRAIRAMISSGLASLGSNPLRDIVPALVHVRE